MNEQKNWNVDCFYGEHLIRILFGKIYSFIYSDVMNIKFFFFNASKIGWEKFGHFVGFSSKSNFNRKNSDNFHLYAALLLGEDPIRNFRISNHLVRPTTLNLIKQTFSRSYSCRKSEFSPPDQTTWNCFKILLFEYV